MQPTTTYEESSSTFETQFSQQEIEPDALVAHADFFRLTDDAKARLAKAKSQLKDAVSLALTIDQSKLDESLTQDEIEANAATLKELANHFAGTVPTIQWESVETRYVNTGMGWQPQEVGVKYNIKAVMAPWGRGMPSCPRPWESPCVSSRATSSRHLPRAIAAH